MKEATTLLAFFAQFVPLILVYLVHNRIIKPRLQQRKQAKIEEAKSAQEEPLRPLGQIPDSPYFNGGAKRDYAKSFPKLADQLNELREETRERMRAAGVPMHEINLAWTPIAEAFGECLRIARQEFYRTAINGMKDCIAKAQVLVDSLPPVPVETTEPEA